MIKVEFHFLKDYAREKNIHIIEINGYLDHVHCLIRMDPKMSLSKIIQYLKGGSSFWINKNNILKDFSWSKEYYASSICEDHVPVIAQYIRNQEAHHSPITYSSAYLDWICDGYG